MFPLRPRDNTKASAARSCCSAIAPVDVGLPDDVGAGSVTSPLGAEEEFSSRPKNRAPPIAALNKKMARAVAGKIRRLACLLIDTVAIQVIDAEGVRPAYAPGNLSIIEQPSATYANPLPDRRNR